MTIQLDERGAVMVWVVLWLPVFLVILGLVVDAGIAFADRALLHSASDLGALAGVQELDLEQLAAGRRYILPEQARSHAEETAARILSANGRGSAREIDVWVHNPGTGGLLHPISGRLLLDPTVTVRSRVENDPVILFLLPSYALSAYADASVLPRRDP